MRLTDQELREVFARAEEIDKFYVAEVLSTSEEGARVRFLRGSELALTPAELRPCAFVPGERVTCNWPMWGPWTCTVVAYDAAKQRVKLSDGWGSMRTFPVSEVWLVPTKADAWPAGARTRFFWGPAPQQAL